MPQGYIQEDTYQFSSFYHPGKWSNSWVLQRIIQVSSLESMWTLKVPEGVLVVFDMVDAPRILQRSCISIFISLPIWEVLHLLCVSRASSWSLRGSWRFLRGVLVVSEMVDASRIHPGSCISIYKTLPSRKVFELLGSPEHHPSVILGVYEDAGGS